MSMIEIRLDVSRFRAFIERLGGAPEAALGRFRREGSRLVGDEISEKAPKRTLALAGSVVVDDSHEDYVLIYPSAAHAKWVVRGTGVFGPRGRRIFPVRAQALRFRIGEEILFRRSVAGMRANPFVKRAAEAVTPKLAQLVRDIAGEVYA